MQLNELQPEDVKTIIIAGDNVEVELEDSIMETLKDELENRGIDSFTVLIDGREITNSNDFPETFADCGTVEVRRSVKAGR